MVTMFVTQGEDTVVLNCEKSDNTKFCMVLDRNTGDILEKPANAGIDESTAYGKVRRMIRTGTPLPPKITSEWG